jgi:ribosomal protein L31E
MSNALAQQKMIVEGLRQEYNGVKREKMSKTVPELVDYVRQHQGQDSLIIGIDKKSNHFIEKSSCEVL